MLFYAFAKLRLNGYMENVQSDLEETSNWDNSSESNFGEFIACLILLPFALCGLRKDMYKQDLIEYCQ